MHVLVTGGTGFVGRHLCRELDERGHDVTALARSPRGAKLPSGVATVRGDVTDRDSLDSPMAGMDAVVHLVALSPLYQPKGGEARHEAVTTEGTRNVVDAAESADVERLVYQSALGADPETRWAYSRAKGRAEAAVRSSSLDWTIVRPSVIFGEGGEFVDFTRLVTTPYVTGLPGGGRTMRFQPIWIEEFVPLLANCLEDGAHVGQTYEVGGREQLSLADVTRAVYRARGQSVSILPVPIAVAKLGMALADPLPFVPLGRGQGHAFRYENVTDDNAAEALGADLDSLTTLGEYLERT
ncbi:MAG: complex I NDUFA9 subunit family protein [Halobacteriales archaeon]|nr:complex I NDUFA9 subunit family protein [Halobacteriales archaeon]